MTQMRYLCRRLRRRWPDLHIVLVGMERAGRICWLSQQGARWVPTRWRCLMKRRCFAWVTSLAETLDAPYLPAPIPRATSSVSGHCGPAAPSTRRCGRSSTRRASAPPTSSTCPLALVTLIDEDKQCVGGGSGECQGGERGGTSTPKLSTWRATLSMCGHVVASGEMMVVEDIARDPRFANNPALQGAGHPLLCRRAFRRWRRARLRLAVHPRHARRAACPSARSGCSPRWRRNWAACCTWALRIPPRETVQVTAPPVRGDDLPSASVGQPVPG